MAYTYTCRQCGEEYERQQFGVEYGFCSKGCEMAFNEALQRKKKYEREERERQAEKQRQKDLESTRKKAEKSLKRANKQLAKWQKKVNLIESALESGDDLKALKKAAKATDDPMEMVLGFLFLAGLVWYFCFR